MIPRQATVLVCDELLISVTGKFTLLGNYTGDISIPTVPTIVPQLVFYFIIESDINDVYRSLSLQVALPKSPPIVQPLPIILQTPTQPDRSRWTMRWPLLVSQPTLNPGRIETKVIHESGEIVAGTPWIVLASQQSQLTAS
jgi:hypothetical protein